MSTIHAVKEVLTKKKDSHGNRISKPQCIQEYTQNMSGVDISDQYMAFHVNLHKSMKWSRKLFFHLYAPPQYIHTKQEIWENEAV